MNNPVYRGTGQVSLSTLDVSTTKEKEVRYWRAGPRRLLHDTSRYPLFVAMMLRTMLEFPEN